MGKKRKNNFLKSELMTTLNIIGYIAAVGTTLAFIPQAYKVFQTKKTGDLSFGTFLIFSFGLVMWVVYGFMSNALPIILANSITFLMAFYILIMKIFEKK
jgi:MtN3 and saliva related transmembrane protein